MTKLPLKKNEPGLRAALRIIEVLIREELKPSEREHNAHRLAGIREVQAALRAELGTAHLHPVDG